MSSACNSCGAPVRWCLIKKTGRKMPINTIPTPDARPGFVLRVGGEAELATDEDRRLLREIYTSHFATCPQAHVWRQAK